jgi:hypothetical protein
MRHHDRRPPAVKRSTAFRINCSETVSRLDLAPSSTRIGVAARLAASAIASASA